MFSIVIFGAVGINNVSIIPDRGNKIAMVFRRYCDCQRPAPVFLDDEKLFVVERRRPSCYRIGDGCLSRPGDFLFDDRAFQLL